MEERESHLGVTPDASSAISDEPQLPMVVHHASHGRDTGISLCEYFTQAITSLTDGASGLLWRHTSHNLRLMGIHRQLPQALLTVAVMVSAKLHEPVAMFIQPGPGVSGSHFLNTVKSLIPGELKVDFTGLTQKVLSQDPAVVDKKVIIVSDVSPSLPPPRPK